MGLEIIWSRDGGPIDYYDLIRDKMLAGLHNQYDDLWMLIAWEGNRYVLARDPTSITEEYAFFSEGSGIKRIDGFFGSPFSDYTHFVTIDEKTYLHVKYHRFSGIGHKLVDSDGKSFSGYGQVFRSVRDSVKLDGKVYLLAVLDDPDDYANVYGPEMEKPFGDMFYEIVGIRVGNDDQLLARARKNMKDDFFYYNTDGFTKEFYGKSFYRIAKLLRSSSDESLCLGQKTEGSGLGIYDMFNNRLFDASRLDVYFFDVGNGGIISNSINVIGRKAKIYRYDGNKDRYYLYGPDGICLDEKLDSFGLLSCFESTYYLLKKDLILSGDGDKCDLIKSYLDIVDLILARFSGDKKLIKNRIEGMFVSLENMVRQGNIDAVSFSLMSGI